MNRFYGKGAFTNINLHEDRLMAPLKWRKPSMVFVNSMSDLFHDDVPFEFIDAVFTVMADCEHHIFQILTKRSNRMVEFFQWKRNNIGGFPWWSPENVWLGVSVEDQEAANKRIPDLLRVDASVRFLSCEPLLNELDITDFLHDSNCNEIRRELGCICCEPREVSLDWVIVGGESGPNARPVHPDWVRSLRDQCGSTNVPFFFKQWGEWAPAHSLMCNHPTFKGKLWYNFDPDTSVCRIGKKLAGNKLDGHTYMHWPSNPITGKEVSNA